MSICIPRKPLSRRAMLRGLTAGAVVTVGLPRLGAMLNSNGTAYAQGAPLPKRFGVWFWGNGIIPPRWIPKMPGVGSAWQLSEQLMPFATVKKYLTVLTGYQVNMPGSVHRIGPAGALSGTPHTAALNYNAPTIDHLISKLIGGTTPFKSLEVGVSRATANGEGQAVNYASSSGPNTPVQPEYDAKAVFTRLFGKAPGTTMPGVPDRSLGRRKRVLDTISEDARQLRVRLGTEDTRRLDQHLDGIQQLEKRITALPSMMPPTSGCNLPMDAATRYPAPLPDNNGLVTPELNSAMAELTTYALACDLTRVFLFQHGRPAAHYNMGVIGINVDIHDDISHQEAGDQPKMHSAIMYWMDHFKFLLEKMAATPDGAGNLLDNSLIYATSDVSFGKTHSVDEFPAMLFGKAGGLVKGDQHIRSVKDNISKLLFTIINVFGGKITTFGSAGGLVTTGVPEILT
ncbi:MAG TPA: DUF1552 domain-containing protein [Polyangia bacterium]|nr:DUF1552 domain-containing protein [Polyangia bacterium]